MHSLSRYFNTFLLFSFVLLFASSNEGNQNKFNKDLIGYWQLIEDTKDRSGNNLQTKIHGSIEFNFEGPSGKLGAAKFNGKDAWLEVLSTPGLHVSDEDFSITAWIHTEDKLDDVLGDIFSKYDRTSKRGYQLSLKNNATTTSHSNYRQLNFGIDDDESSPWMDSGRPGNALLAFGLAEYKGALYASTCETKVDESGHVYRYSKGKEWIDCGSPDSSNSVVTMAVLNGELYAGTGHYRVGGSSLPESENTIPGGRVFRFIPPDQWENCGQLPGVEMTGGMIIYNGKLYASSTYSPGLFRYEGGKEWVDCGAPDNKRVVYLAVYDGYLYATSLDGAHVYRYDGEKWEDCGQVGGEENTQTYAFAVYEGELYVATWRSGRVFRFEGINQWKDVGRLGDELEVMGMLVYNGRLIAGTLPMGEVYSYEGDTTWSRLDQLDKTPDATYRRAWTMAEHAGKLFCSTLPSGKVYGFEAGKSVTSKDEFSPGWQHIAAIKTKDWLKLYINGLLVNEMEIPASMKLMLDNDVPLKIGFGSNDYFNGRMCEIRLYKRELEQEELNGLMNNL